MFKINTSKLKTPKLPTMPKIPISKIPKAPTIKSLGGFNIKQTFTPPKATISKSGTSFVSGIFKMFINKK